MSPPQAGGSRLQKLLKLIDGGASLETRKAAAAQVASIAASHPSQLPSVLAQVAVHLKHKEWDARVAAAHCLGLLAEHFVHTSVPELCQAAGVTAEELAAAAAVKQEGGDEEGAARHLLHFEGFEITQVLGQGTALLASWGMEFDEVADSGSNLAKQRQNLKKRLGLGGPMDAFVDTSDLIRDEDLLAVGAAPSRRGRVGRQSSGSAPPPPQKEATQLLADMSGLSARERAAALRKAKSGLKRGMSMEQPCSPTKKSRLAGGEAGPAQQQQQQQQQGSGGGEGGSAAGSEGVQGEAAAAGPGVEQEWEEILAGRWPFQALCDRLCMDVLHPLWEVRHGAAAALREILSTHAAAAGVHAPVSADLSGWAVAGGSGKRALGGVSITEAAAAHAANAGWVEDCAIHLLCVLALDRFGDFVSDQVVAPVRETAAQALGAATQPLPPAALRLLLGVLRQLSECSEWEVRHGGLLGLKYVLAARGGGAAHSSGGGGAEGGSSGGMPGEAELLEAVLPAALVGLRDKDDDVRAVAAEALLPVATSLAADPSPTAAAVRQLLWDILLTLEDLSPATASVMTLLAEMYTAAAGSAGMGAGMGGGDLSAMVPRLWPFLRHGLTSVRLAAVRCAAALLRCSGGEGLLGGEELRRALRLLFQNLLLERNEEVLARSSAAWQLLVTATPAAQLRAVLGEGEGQGGQSVLGMLCQLACTPNGRALAPSLMLAVPPPAGKPSVTSPAKGAGAEVAAKPQQESHVVGADGDSAHATRMRLAVARALGQLARALSSADGAANPLTPHIISCLRGSTASARQLGALVATHWAQEQHSPAAAAAAAGAGAAGAAGAAEAQASLPPDLQQLLGVLLELLAPGGMQAAPFAELAPLYAQLRSQASAVVARGVAAGVPLTLPQPLEALGAEGALALAAQIPAGAAPELELGRQALQSSAALLQGSEAFLSTSVAAALAVGVVNLGVLPPKLNSVIQPLVAAVRREPEPLLQDLAAAGLARLCLLSASRTPCPNDKIIKNVCAFACGDPAATPSVAQPPSLQQEQEQEGSAAKSGNAASLLRAAGLHNGTPPPVDSSAQQDVNARALALARKGGEAALQHMAREAGPALLTSLPKVWDQVATPLVALITPLPPPPPAAAAAAPPAQPAAAAAPAVAAAQQQGAAGAAAAAQLQPAVHAMHVLRVVGPDLHSDLLQHVLSLLPLVALCSQHPNPALKLAAACCFAALAAAHTQPVMPVILRLLTPLMAGGAPESSRVGALVCVRALVGALGLRLVPYALLLVVPLIGRMSDSSPLARSLASACFASVVALMPLMDRSLAPPPGLDEFQLATWCQEGGFLQQLLDNSAAEDYVLPIQINGTLRRYQQEGVNWLAFLRRFGLHGVLADDMGLGKTLQATAIIASTTFEQRQKFAESGLASDAPRPSLIVCPSTLVAHWPFEIAKFVGREGPGGLRPLQYQGTPSERAALRSQLPVHDVVVMAYESLRADIDWVSGMQWGYCVLDEGHTIRNPGSKITQACKRVPAQHRLILSGTPIQNNVLELWSLFDFLMPGFLGSERQFNSTYGKALQVAKSGVRQRSGNSTGGGAAGLVALDRLHRQVMPFILRRTKGQVLRDLPPKIIQDVLCEPSVLQRALYEDFAQGQALQQISGVVQGGGLASSEAAAKAPHVFQALLYLRKLCSHPLLVLDPQQPQHIKALTSVLGHRHGSGSGTGGLDLEWAQAQLHAHLHHAPKLLALQELLLDCGIGREPGSKAEEGSLGADEEGGGPGHRVLVFAQLRAMLDLVERDVLAPMGVSSLRIDGGVDSAERFRRVQQFNSDPTIDVMLLTTQVGGLGLNLTAADTVIFLEHDWNPMKDLQAMDRAHRLGQQRSVSVYRLLVRGTLEEQIMSLQQFKLDVAATLVNQDNASLAAMDTSNLLELFGPEQQQQQQDAQQRQQGGSKRGGLAAMLESLGDVAAHEEQYAQEFGLDAFKSKLAKPGKE